MTVNIPKGTPNGKELRLRGLGMPVYAKKNEFGDMLVKVEIVLPEHLSEHETDLFKELAGIAEIARGAVIIRAAWKQKINSQLITYQPRT